MSDALAVDSLLDGGVGSGGLVLAIGKGTGLREASYNGRCAAACWEGDRPQRGQLQRRRAAVGQSQKGVQGSPVGPIFGAADESGAHGVLPDIVPFFSVTFLGAQQVIKELGLPELSWVVVSAVQVFGGPFFPFPDEQAEGRVGVSTCAAKEMHMVRHHDVGSDTPAIESLGVLPDFLEDADGHIIGQERGTFMHVGWDEVDGGFDP